MGTFLIIVLIVAGMWWLGRDIEEGFNQIAEDRERALEQQERHNNAIEKLGDWLDRH